MDEKIEQQLESWSSVKRRVHHRRRFEDTERMRLYRHVDPPTIWSVVEEIRRNPEILVVAVCAAAVIVLVAP